MAVYMVTYDLIKPHQDYPDLIKAIKEIGTTWCKPLLSTWLIVHDGPATAIRDALSQHIDDDDKLLVQRVAKGCAIKGPFSPKVTAWLANNIK